MRIQGPAHGLNADDQRIVCFQRLDVAEFFPGLSHELDLLWLGLGRLKVGPKRSRRRNAGRLIHALESDRNQLRSRDRADVVFNDCVNRIVKIVSVA